MTVNPLPGTARRARDERGGGMSVLLITSVVVIILIAGLIVDGGRRNDAAAAAQAAAAAAARAGSDAAAKQAIAGAPVDVGLVMQAANDYLAQAGVRGSVSVQGTTVQVTATESRPTLFLSLVGVNSVSGHASATSELLNPATQR